MSLALPHQERGTSAGIVRGASYLYHPRPHRQTGSRDKQKCFVSTSQTIKTFVVVAVLIIIIFKQIKNNF